VEKREPGLEHGPLATVNGWLLPVITPYRYPAEALRLARDTASPPMKKVVREELVAPSLLGSTDRG